LQAEAAEIFSEWIARLMMKADRQLAEVRLDDEEEATA